MTPKETAFVLLVAGLVVGTFAQSVVTHEAAVVLGLTALEVGLIGLAVPVVAKRLA